jgi:hypothetical protein
LINKRKLNPLFKGAIKNMQEFHKPKGQKEPLSIYQLCYLLMSYVHPSKKTMKLDRDDLDEFLYFIEVAERSSN